MKITAGEVWKIDHVRKGPLTVRVLRDVETSDPDAFTDVEIIEGEVRSISGNLGERQVAFPGDAIGIRASLAQWIERLK